MARVILRDGRAADLRLAQSNAHDRAMIHSLFAEASAESLYFRFFHVVREVTDNFISNMLENSYTLLCLAGERALGVSSYTPVNEDTAEVAFLVGDRLHGKGLGTLMLEHLAEAAWKQGLKRFEAYVLSENHKMLQVFEASGYEVTSQRDSNILHLVLPLARTERSRALCDTREKLATAASIHPFLRPNTVAVVGASRDPNRLGHILLRRILEGGFQGTVYPVNPTAAAVSSIRAYPSITAIPESVDLAIIVVPSSQVLPVIDDCVQAGVGAVMIISAGFAETDTAGLQLQEEVVQRLRQTGCRLIGPNCLGLLNTDMDLRLNASFAPKLPASGSIAIASQSGGLGVAILEYASRMGIGVSSFVSTGNKADVSSNDLLLYWEDDPEAKIIVLYLESFGNPRKFSRIARRITQKKPILAVKSARSPSSAAISEARSVALPATDVTVDALFRQTGILRVDSLRELFDVAALLASGPLPNGRRVAIVTNTAGGAVMTVDAILREGLELVPPPIDLGFETLPEMYRDVLPHVLRDSSVDAVIAIFIPVGLSEEAQVSAAIAEAIREVASESAQTGLPLMKPVVANFLMSPDSVVRYIDAGIQKVPVYPFPEQAARAVAKVVDYADYLKGPRGRIPDLAEIDPDSARSTLHTLLSSTPSALPSEIAQQVLQWFGIRIESLTTDSNSLKSGSRRFTLTIEQDKLFGPVLAIRRLPSVASGAQEVDPLRLPRCIRITPLTDVDALEMARDVMGEIASPDEHSQMKHLVEVLLRVSILVEEVPEVRSVRFPEIVIQSDGYWITTADIHIGTSHE